MQSRKMSGMRLLGIAVVAISMTLGLASKSVASPLVLQLGQSVGLADIINQHGSVQVGDKIFADFSIVGDVTANKVTVTAIQDTFGYGLRFSGGFLAVGNQITDFVLGFSVAVDPQAVDWFISDVHLRFNGNYVGEGFAEIVEQVFSGGPAPLGSLLGQMFVSNPPTILENTFYLQQPLKKIYVLKDVLLYGGGDVPPHKRLGNVAGTNRATISVIDQTFSQIPEPGTVLLVAAGLLGVALTGRRRG
ncbi:MAG: PEP-CTERM sorting domain-containing protein [Verrucomicrobiae bacterium]|nr:PEP-CTERM sorting domain-containing protein [Verrucomicrobiae bacterium]